MSPEAIGAVGAIQEPSLAPLTNVANVANVAALGDPAGAAPVGEAGGFGQLVTQGIQQVSEQLCASEISLQQLAAGAPVNLHQVMIGLEESRMSFQLLLQVRNRLLEGYQSVMNMQV